MSGGTGWDKAEHSTNYYNLKRASLTYSAALILLSIVVHGPKLNQQIFGFSFRPDQLILVGFLLSFTVIIYSIQFFLAWIDEAHFKLPSDSQSLSSAMDRIHGDALVLKDELRKAEDQLQSLYALMERNQESARSNRLMVSGSLEAFLQKFTNDSAERGGDWGELKRFAWDHPGIRVDDPRWIDVAERLSRQYVELIERRCTSLIEQEVAGRAEVIASIETGIESASRNLQAILGTARPAARNLAKATQLIQSLRGARQVQFFIFDAGGVTITAIGSLAGWIVVSGFMKWLLGH